MDNECAVTDLQLDNASEIWRLVFDELDRAVEHLRRECAARAIEPHAGTDQRDYARRFARHGSASEQLRLIDVIIREMIEEHAFSAATSSRLINVSRHLYEIAIESEGGES